MDASDEYIKMCEKAKEIQNKWKGADRHIYPTPGDYVLIKTIEFEGVQFLVRNHGRVSHYFCSKNAQPRSTYDMIWLPRQDQLHPMSGLPWYDFDEECRRITVKHPVFIETFFSKEKAGLSLIMKMKHRKYWNGEDWVTYEERFDL
jgi:hypothetical protein